MTNQNSLVTTMLIFEIELRKFGFKFLSVFNLKTPTSIWNNDEKLNLAIVGHPSTKATPCVFLRNFILDSCPRVWIRLRLNNFAHAVITQALFFSYIARKASYLCLSIPRMFNHPFRLFLRRPLATINAQMNQYILVVP